MSPVDPNTPLFQRTLTNPFGIFPSEIWQLIFNFCSTPTLTILCSVSKSISAAIKRIEFFEEAKLYTQNFIETNTISSFKKSVCTNVYLLHQGHFEEIQDLDQMIHRPLQDLKELLHTREPNNTEIQPIAKFVNVKANTLLTALAFCVIMTLSTVSCITVLYTKNWDIKKLISNSDSVSLIIIFVLFILAFVVFLF